MNIVHISGTAFGGAGRAAWRLHEAMLEAGTNSVFYSIDEWTDEDSKNKKAHRLYNALPSGLRQRVIYKWRNVFLNQNADDERRLLLSFENERSKWYCETAALPFGYRDLYLIPHFRNADAIILHSVNGILNLARFFTDFKSKPVIWTLHDMNPFQGLFHYKEDEIRNAQTAKELDHLTKEIKFRALQSTNDKKLAVVAPSHWLVNEARHSRLLGKFPVECIPYSLNLTTFRPKEKERIRQELGLKMEEKVLLFIADNLRNIRKGFDLLLEAFKCLHNVEITLIAIGEDRENMGDKQGIRFAGKINSDDLMADYFNVADAFVLPSREDNLPNVMLEAFACGCPVISFPVGGMKDHIIDGETGILASEISGKSLAIAIDRFFSGDIVVHHEKIRQYAQRNFNPQNQVNAYARVIARLS